jgi:hypothetical protein
MARDRHQRCVQRKGCSLRRDRCLASLVPSRLGRLRQAALRRSSSCAGYLARYTHRVAITNHRLVAFEHDQVTFRWKDYARGNKKENHDPRFPRVPTPLLAPRPAWRLCPHPLFRLPRHSPPCQTLAPLSAPARRPSQAAHTRSRHFFPHSAHLSPLPKMFHSHVHRGLCHACLATLDREPVP